MSIKKRYFFKKGSFIKRDFFQKNNGRTGVMYTMDKGSLKGIANTALYKTIDSYPTMVVRSNIKDENGNFVRNYRQSDINQIIFRAVNQRAAARTKNDPNKLVMTAALKEAKSQYLHKRAIKGKYYEKIKRKMPKRAK